MKKTEATVYSETNYSKFIPDVHNRSVVKLGAMLASMKKYGWLVAHPAHVKANCKPGFFVVVDGQHRVEAAKQLGLPVKYVIDDTEISAADVSKAQNRWTLKDYLSAYCKQGSQAYLDVADYINRTGIKLSQAASMFSGDSAGSGNILAKFKDGSFTVKSREHPERVGTVVLKVSPHFQYSRDSYFVAAVSAACFVKQFDDAVFIDKAEKNPNLLRRQATLDDYKSMLEVVYNRSSKRPIPLKFYIDEAMRSRSFCPGGKKKN